MKSQRFFHFGTSERVRPKSAVRIALRVRLLIATAFLSVVVSVLIAAEEAAANNAANTAANAAANAADSKATARVRVLTPAAKDVLEKIEKTLSSEARDEAAQNWLSEKPRKEILSSLREGLSSDTHWSHVAASGAVQLKAVELLPELLKLSQETGDWQVLLALEVLSRGSSVRPDVDQLLNLQLKTKSSAAKAVALNALKESRTILPNEMFDGLIKDRSGTVRELTVQHFLATRELLPKEEQLRRFELALQLKPSTARLAAFKGYEALSVSESTGLTTAVSAALCKKEQNVDVKAVCDRIVLKLQKGAK